MSEDPYIDRQEKVIECHQFKNDVIVGTKSGVLFPCVAIHSTGARLTGRLYQNFKKTFYNTPFVICNDLVSKKNMKLATFADVETLLEMKSLHTYDKDKDNEGVCVYGVVLLEAPTMDCMVLLRLVPLLAIESIKQFQNILEIVGEKSCDRARVQKMGLYNPLVTTSDVVNTVTSLVATFIMDYIHSQHILLRYIASIYHFIYKFDSIKSILDSTIVNDKLKDKKVRVIAYPKSILPSIIEEVDERETEKTLSFEMSPKDFTHVLYVFHAYNTYCCSVVERGDWACPPPYERQRLGMKGNDTNNTSVPVNREITQEAVNLTKSQNFEWVETNAACQGKVSRAYYKLHESLHFIEQNRPSYEPYIKSINEKTENSSTYGWWLNPDSTQPPPVTCIDVGACPGGWTLALLEKNARVFSVDPGTLSIRHKNVTHIPHKLQDKVCMDIINKEMFDMCVCDVNLDLSSTIDILEPLFKDSNLMKPGSIIIITLKSFATKTMKKIMDDGFARLEPYFSNLCSTWLLSNRHERTIIGIRKPW